MATKKIEAETNETFTNYFTELNSVNVQDKVEKKNGLTYLSWAYAWGELKKRFPDASYTVYENADGWNYFHDGSTCWVKTGVTVNGIEHIEYLPVMDYKNKSIALGSVTSFDVNKSIQRSLTKAVARHGLGLYIYAGEDLPDDSGRQVPDYRSMLRQFLKDVGMDANKIIKECNLTQQSSNDEWKKALEYSKSLYLKEKENEK